MQQTISLRSPVIQVSRRACNPVLAKRRLAFANKKFPSGAKHLRATSAEDFSIPWMAYVAEQDRVARRMQEERIQAAQERDKRMLEIGELQAQKAQLLQQLIYARGEIDVRGAIEIIAKIEEMRMPPSKQRRGVQTVLSWMVNNNTTFTARIRKTCKQAKLEESRVREILQNSLYKTACKPLHGTSHVHLAVCEPNPWPANEAAAICILLEYVGLDYEYRDRAGKPVPSPYI